MSSGKLLTISIPTWNRSVLLNGLLSELTQEIILSGLEKDVEILVSNNNSEDDTEQVVKNFSTKFSFVNYNRNSTNIGAKSNVLKSMYMASSKFVLFIGDDDKLSRGALSQLITELKNRNDVGVLIDTALSRYGPETGEISLEKLLFKYYWYIGNAGFFVIQSDLVRQYLDEHGYDFFNECWPQTQIMILTLAEHKELKCILVNIGMHAESAHGEVMLYNSFYLWRTCYYELTLSIDSIAGKVLGNQVAAAKSYLKNSIKQQLFNILQCGLFVDSQAERKMTRNHIISHLRLFSFYENLFFIIIAVTLSLPTFITRPVANIFIFISRGKNGLSKKNDFVKKEIDKRIVKGNFGSVRTLEFEKK